MKVRTPIGAEIKKTPEYKYFYAICIGTEFTSTKNKSLIGFLPITDNEFLEKKLNSLRQDRAMYFDKKSLKKYITPGPGIVYHLCTYHDTGEDFFSFSQFQYAGMWPDETYRAKLQEEDRLRRADRELKREEKDGKEDNALKESLQIARKIYHESPYMHKSLVLARIVEYITRR